MKFSDFHDYTEQQRNRTDKEAIDMAKRSMIVLLRSLHINVSPIPAPILHDGNWIERFRRGYIKDYYHDDVFEDRAELALILYMFYDWQGAQKDNDERWKYVIQTMIDVCYYLACNGTEIVEFPQMTEDNIRILSRFGFYEDSKVTPGQLDTAFVATPIKQVKIVHNATSVLPMSLLHHLTEIQSVGDIVMEVCRLQMLSPEQVRTESAFDALINAWNCIKRR